MFLSHGNHCQSISHTQRTRMRPGVLIEGWSCSISRIITWMHNAKVAGWRIFVDVTTIDATTGCEWRLGVWNTTEQSLKKFDPSATCQEKTITGRVIHRDFRWREAYLHGDFFSPSTHFFSCIPTRLTVFQALHKQTKQSQEWQKLPATAM